MNVIEDGWIPSAEPEALSTPDEVPSTEDQGSPIKEFHIRHEDMKKAKLMRQALSESAPGISGKAILATPIVVRPKVPKNRMYACQDGGERVLTINLKNGVIEFTGTI